MIIGLGLTRTNLTCTGLVNPIIYDYRVNPDRVNPLTIEGG